MERLQFIAQVDVALANANPRNLGPAGATFPSILLTYNATGAAGPSQTVDLSAGAVAYVVGVRGLKDNNAFVLPGRRLGGLDGSTSLVGLYVTGANVTLFAAVLLSGTIKRFALRRSYRNQVYVT